MTLAKYNDRPSESTLFRRCREKIISFAGNKKAVLFFLIIVGFSVYANALPNKMFWDDDDWVLKNAYIKDWNYFGKYFSENVIAGAGLSSNYWRPLLLTVHSVEWKLWKNWTPGYHFISIAAHILAAFLLYYFLRNLLTAPLLALVTGLFFLIHPLATEAVVYISGRGDPLQAVFLLAALIFYLKAERPAAEVARSCQQVPKTICPLVSCPAAERPASDVAFALSARDLSLAVRRQGNIGSGASKFIFLSAISFMLGLLSKETAIILPALLLLTDFYLSAKSRGQTHKIDFRKFFLIEARRLWPFISIAAVYVFLRITVLDFGNTLNLYNESNFYTTHLSARIFTFAKVLLGYFPLIATPVGLHMERQVDVAKDFWQWQVAGGIMAMILLLALAASAWRKRPGYTFAILWFFIGLFPVSGIAVPINGLMYEHWLYFPQIGILLLAGLLGRDLWRKYPYRITAVLLLAVSLSAVSFFTIQTVRQNRVWRDPVTLYQNILKYNRGSARVWNNLGMAYADLKNYPAAISAYQEAIRLSGGKQAATRYNLANSYRDSDRQADAETEYQESLVNDPRFIFSYYNLADLYLRRKDYPKAIRVLEQARLVFPQDQTISRAVSQIQLFLDNADH